MPNYHLYFMRRGQFVSAVDIEARDDDEATRLARQKDDGDVVEVWNDDRRLRILGTAGPELAAGAPDILTLDEQEIGHGG